MGRTAAIALAVTTLLLTGAANAQYFGMDPGEVLFGECRDCHTFEEGAPHGRKGPNLWGVFGRKAGTASGYEYTPEMRASGIIWTETTVDKWIRNPNSLVPGTRMDFMVPNDEQREYILEYMRNADIPGYLRAMQKLREAQ